MATLVHEWRNPLDVSRPSRGKQELQRERLTLRSVLVQMIDARRPFIDAAPQELPLHLPPEPLHLEVHATRRAQVVGYVFCDAGVPGMSGDEADRRRVRQAGFDPKDFHEERLTR